MMVVTGMNSMLTLMCISVFRWVVLTKKVTTIYKVLDINKIVLI